MIMGFVNRCWALAQSADQGMRHFENRTGSIRRHLEQGTYPFYHFTIIPRLPHTLNLLPSPPYPQPTTTLHHALQVRLVHSSIQPFKPSRKPSDAHLDSLLTSSLPIHPPAASPHAPAPRMPASATLAPTQHPIKPLLPVDAKTRAPSVHAPSCCLWESFDRSLRPSVFPPASIFPLS